MRNTSSQHPADSQRAVNMGGRQSKASQDPVCHLTTDTWASSIGNRQARASSAENPSWPVDAWAIIKAYCLKSPGFGGVYYVAIVNCYSPYIPVLLSLSCYSGIHILCLSHALNKPSCQLFHGFTNVKPLSGLQTVVPSPLFILLMPSYPWSLITRMSFTRQEFQSPLSPHLFQLLLSASPPVLLAVLIYTLVRTPIFSYIQLFIKLLLLPCEFFAGRHFVLYLIPATSAISHK